MTKKEAIKILKRQRNKLDEHPKISWIIQTKSINQKIFGERSAQAEIMDEFMNFNMQSQQYENQIFTLKHYNDIWIEDVESGLMCPQEETRRQKIISKGLYYIGGVVSSILVQNAKSIGEFLLKLVHK